MKLKTLKDLTVLMQGRKRQDSDRTMFYDYIHIGERIELVWPGHLKEEAIKWIKADKSNYYSRQGKEETILWIKHFFNITEEDLK